MTEGRTPSARYADPLNLIWLGAANEMGMKVERSDAAYASWDGRDTLTITTEEHMDADDCLAQMIFHEACHALVAGPEGRRMLDWGLDNTTDRDVVAEHATNRLQAALSDRYGLRRFFATTTEFRSYYDRLPPDPLAPDADPAAALARQALGRARVSTWKGILDAALRRTAELAAVLRPIAPVDSLWRTTEPLHRSGFVLDAGSTHTCGDCAWARLERGGKGALGCRQSGFDDEACAVAASDPACVRFEVKLTDNDCGRCGACCREGFDLVQVRSREPFRKQHPDLVATGPVGDHVPRPGGRCVALDGDGGAQLYRCRHYAERPSACAEFEVAGDACLEARRRVGLSR